MSPQDSLQELLKKKKDCQNSNEFYTKLILNAPCNSADSFLYIHTHTHTHTQSLLRALTANFQFFSMLSLCQPC